MNRDIGYDILPQISTRWSMRSFSNEPVLPKEYLPLFEAARWAPSCFNEQPWKFIIADTPESHEKVAGVLTDSNKIWASKAPLLIVLCAVKVFAANGKDNYWNRFDSGTAWGYFSIEAEKRGLAAHAMGGFDKDKAIRIFELPADIEPITIIALGKPGKKDSLPPDLRERENPGLRKPLSSILFYGSMNQSQK